MTGETLERVGSKRYRCTECGGESKTRLPNHESDCPVITDERPSLHIGDHVTDEQAPDATMLVVATPVETASEYELDDGRTISDVNPRYPVDDDVVEVVFPKRTDVDLQNCNRYAYPRSRLERTQTIHTEGDDGGE